MQKSKSRLKRKVNIIFCILESFKNFFCAVTTGRGEELFIAFVGHKVVLADYCDLEFCGIYDGSSQALDSSVFVQCQFCCLCWQKCLISCRMAAEFILRLMKCSRES